MRWAKFISITVIASLTAITIYAGIYMLYTAVSILTTHVGGQRFIVNVD